MKEAILLTDGYKLDHRRQYPEGTEYVYSNWTPRSCHYYPEASEGAVVFGIQYFIKEYLMKQFQENFFNKPNNVGTKHIEELHDLGYLPIRIKALPEGTLCPIRVPALTFINTHPDFFWLTNYFETLISTTLWLPMTSATTARLYKKELIRHARKTGFKDVDLNFLIHDFSMRGILFGLNIVYLMSMRMDRVISYDESFSLSVVTQVINDMFPQAVHVLEPHSHKVQDLVDEYWGDIATPMPDFEGYLKVYPDKGALQRYGGDPNSDVICSKVRDPKTGQLSGFKIENPEVIEKNVNLPFVVIDDLCDGGGTFKGIAQLLDFHYPDRERTIYVTHMVNPKGITTLSENYKEVYFTNSYKDWNKEILPDNVKVIEIV